MNEGRNISLTVDLIFTITDPYYFFLSSTAPPPLLLFLLLLLLDRHCSASVASGLRFLLLLLLHFFQICSFLSTPLLSLELDLDSHILYVERLVCNFLRLSKSKCVDTQADCVDTTSYWLQNRLLGGALSVDTQADCVNTTGYCFRIGFWEGHLSLELGNLPDQAASNRVSYFWSGLTYFYSMVPSSNSEHNLAYCFVRGTSFPHILGSTHPSSEGKLSIGHSVPLD
ncbi:hypothetical protein Taro_044750 [Colocasia esculenta]|uniref:Uncharacterized protein n=1 Tax=Colocasia esculenta TaxID=4460 RepID=A0A843WPH3_COLES|nr:hypothetical protein [Colocasia esculenta]